MSKRIEFKPPIKIRLLNDFPLFPIDYIIEGDGSVDENGDEFIGEIGGCFNNPNPEDILTVSGEVTFKEANDE